MRLWSTLTADAAPYHVVNLAFGGSTLEACAHFFDRLVVPANPTAIVLYAGDNDLGDGRSVMQVVDSFKLLEAKRAASTPGAALGFISIKPSPARAGIIGRIVEANAAIRELVDASPTSFYIDVFPTLLDDDGVPISSFYQPDGLHLSASGYRAWSGTVLSYASQIFPNKV